MSSTARLWPFLILAIGFALRAVQTHLGLPYVYNFDDPQVAAHALTILKTGDWNPHFFAYGSLMIYIDTIVDAANYLRLAGLPPGAAESMIDYDQLNRINSIVAPMDGRPGWYWTISHPSFYLWNRYVTAIFGTLTVGMTYALSRRVISGPMALLPPLLLAILPVHIVQSGLTTTDVPVAFMVSAATLAALIFAETGGLTAFLTSLLFVGLAATTKYNSGLILVSPLIALAIRLWNDSKSVRWWHWLLLIAVPAVTFLAVMPFALLDFKRFVTDLADSVSSYHAPGPPQARPGIRHIRLILTQFVENIGIVGGLLGLAGAALLVAAARTRKSLTVLIAFPVLFTLYMSTTTADYHRNFMQAYPFICLYVGYAIFRISPLFAGLKVPVRAPVAVALLLAAIVTIPLLYRSVANAANVARARDTRSTAVEKANAVAADQFEILDELHIHATDLNRLNRPHSEVSRQKIVQDICDPPAGRVFILPAELLYTEFLPATAEQTASIETYNALIRHARLGTAQVVIDGPATQTWGPSPNPGILILRVTGRGLCDKAQP